MLNLLKESHLDEKVLENRGLDFKIENQGKNLSKGQK